MAEVQPHKIRKTNSISPEKICLPDWKDLKGNNTMAEGTPPAVTIPITENERSRY